MSANVINKLLELFAVPHDIRQRQQGLRGENIGYFTEYISSIYRTKRMEEGN